MFKFKWGRCSHALGIIYRKVIMSLLFCVRKRKKKREKFEGNLPYLPSTWGKHVKRKKIFFCTWGIHKEKDHFYFFFINFFDIVRDNDFCLIGIFFILLTMLEGSPFSLIVKVEYCLYLISGKYLLRKYVLYI